MKPWKRIEPTTITKVGWRTIVTKTFVMSSGEVTTFDTFGNENQEFVSVIGLTPDNKAIIARQFRVGPERIMEEIVGGYIDHEESPENAARREFLEETGYSAADMSYLGSYNKDSYMNATWHVFLATGCTVVKEQELEVEEEIEVDLISIVTLIENAKHNRMTDSVAVLMAYDLLVEHMTR